MIDTFDPLDVDAVDLTKLSKQIDDAEEHFDVENILRIDQNMFRLLEAER